MLPNNFWMFIKYDCDKNYKISPCMSIHEILLHMWFSYDFCTNQRKQISCKTVSISFLFPTIIFSFHIIHLIQYWWIGHAWILRGLEIDETCHKYVISCLLLS